MKKIIFPAIAGALLFTACNKELPQSNVSAPAEDFQEIPVIFKAGGVFDADVSTKASVVNSGSLETSGFYVAANKKLNDVESAVWGNTKFSYSSGAYKGDKYWPHTANGTYIFYASNVALTASAEGATVSANTDTDVVCAYKDDPTPKATNTLNFEHIFARIGTCNISSPEGYTVTNLSVKITPKTSGVYSIKSSSWTSSTAGSETTIANALNSSTNVDLYLVPEAYTLTATYTITRGEYTENLTKTASVNLVKGKVNNISATLSGDAREIIFDVSVQEWGQESINTTFPY